jgi:hypothetical protein
VPKAEITPRATFQTAITELLRYDERALVAWASVFGNPEVVVDAAKELAALLDARDASPSNDYENCAPEGLSVNHSRSFSYVSRRCSSSK